MVEKAQHDPQWPWSRTDVTTPASRQSTDCGSGPSRGGMRHGAPVAEQSCGSLTIVAMNSAAVMSENWFRPARQLSPFALCAATRRTDSANTPRRYASSFGDAYRRPNSALKRSHDAIDTGSGSAAAATATTAASATTASRTRACIVLQTSVPQK